MVFFTTIKALIGWVVLMFIGTNLVGLIVRGALFSTGVEGQNIPFLKHEVKRLRRTNVGMTVFSVILAVLYLSLLFHFWNIGVVIAAAMLMLARLPDLLWEIRTGQKINRKNMPKRIVYKLNALLMWAALPVLWWALYAA